MAMGVTLAHRLGIPVETRTIGFLWDEDHKLPRRSRRG
jgi:hypothetical protein